jgi:hypothetical protein
VTIATTLEDSNVLLDIAHRAGITIGQALVVVASLAELPPPQATRIVQTAHAARPKPISSSRPR